MAAIAGPDFGGLCGDSPSWQVWAIDGLASAISACRICAARFEATATGHAPRPVVWFNPAARLLIAGQAPGKQVHQSGVPFKDRSGDRLRDWMGVTEAAFYDRSRIAIVSMAFCFPGYDAKGADLPPPLICAATWRAKVLELLPDVRLTLVIGGAAQHWHLGGRIPVSDRVRRWQSAPPGIIPLPHPSWRNTGWLTRNPWFTAELLPDLRRRVGKAMEAER